VNVEIVVIWESGPFSINFDEHVLWVSLSVTYLSGELVFIMYQRNKKIIYHYQRYITIIYIHLKLFVFSYMRKTLWAQHSFKRQSQNTRMTKGVSGTDMNDVHPTEFVRLVPTERLFPYTVACMIGHWCLPCCHLLAVQRFCRSSPLQPILHCCQNYVIN
jgi:hypothetical protein